MIYVKDKNMADKFKEKTENWWHDTISYYHGHFSNPYRPDKKRIHRKARKSLKRDLAKEVDEELLGL